LKVAYLLDSFPRLSETFVINEMLEAQRQGMDIRIFSRRKMDDGMCHLGGRILSEKTHYFPPLEEVGKSKLCLYHLYFLLRSPVNYIKTFLFARKRRSKGTLWFLKMSVIYAFPISRHRVDHIHSHFASLASEYAMLISMLLDIPYTFTTHGYYRIYKLPPEDFDDRGYIAKKVITVSNCNKNYLSAKFSIPRDKIEIIHCGVKSDFFISSVENRHKDNIILSVARLDPVKGLGYLIKACKILKEGKHRFRCLIVREGKSKGNLERLIGDLQLEDFVFLEGAKSHEEVKSYYKTAKVFVQPSIVESMGVAAMEALAHGVPVIATDVYGVPELVEHNGNGFLIKPEDPKAIAHYIGILLKDPELCQKLGENGLRKVKEDFSLEREVAKLTKIWCEDDGNRQAI